MTAINHDCHVRPRGQDWAREVGLQSEGCRGLRCPARHAGEFRVPVLQPAPETGHERKDPGPCHHPGAHSSIKKKKRLL